MRATLVFSLFLQGSVEKGVFFFRNLDPHYTSAFQVFQGLVCGF